MIAFSDNSGSVLYDNLLKQGRRVPGKIQGVWRNPKKIVYGWKNNARGREDAARAWHDDTTEQRRGSKWIQYKMCSGQKVAFHFTLSLGHRCGQGGVRLF